MCRLLAFSFKANTNKQDRIDLVSSFKKLATIGMVPTSIEKGHRDGWGISLYDEDNPLPRVYKSVSQGDKDGKFLANEFFKNYLTQSGLVHLRKKTVGETSVVNTHPFVRGIYSFIHNGTVERGDGPYKELALLCESATDSERLLEKFLEIKKEKETLPAFIEMLSITKENYKNFSAINTILCDGNDLYVSRIINTEHPQYESLGLGNYYSLFVGRNEKDEILITSEKLEYKDMKYSLLPNNSVFTVNLESGEEKFILLD